MRLLILFVLSACPSIDADSATPIEFSSKAERGMMIELYTSEGCSSCPRAEAWLNDLKDDPRLWKQIFRLSFHVDYWDRLGWPDRFADAKWTARQRRYGQLWSSRSIYTPGFAVNGREWRGFLSGEPLPSITSTDPGVLSLSSTNRKNWEINFRPTASMAGLQANIALLGFNRSTAVARGENRGRNLKHDFVVLNLNSARLRKEKNGHRASIEIASRNTEGGRLAVVTWLSRLRDPSPIQVTGGWVHQEDQADDNR